MKMPNSVTLRVSGRAPSATRTDTNAGRHALVMDEPEQRHGNDEGMLPLQALMCSLAGCTNVVANWIAGDLGIEIRDMSFDSAATLDTRSIAGVERVGPPFPEIEFAIEVTTTGTEDQRAKSSSVVWEKTRATMHCTQRSRFRARSLAGSRSPMRPSRWS